MSNINKRTFVRFVPMLATIVMLLAATLFAPITAFAASPAAPLSGAVTCKDPDCIQQSIVTQTQCTQVGPVDAEGAKVGWWKGLSTQIDQQILGGDVVAYKIQWFSGGWSDWYVTGVNDLDWKYNPSTNDMRRVWAYFTDHVHTYIICK